MKRLLGLLMIGFSLTAFTIVNGMPEVISALKNGDAGALARQFDNTVEITAFGKSTNYSKSQGEAVVRDFFDNNEVKGFTVVHQGGSGGSAFLIGNLSTSKGTYRTTVNLKQKGDRTALQEIKFEK